MGEAMSKNNIENKRKKLAKDDLDTFFRLLGFAKPYMWRLIVGAVCSLFGSSSILALLLVGRGLLGFIIDGPDSLLQAEKDNPVASAPAVPGAPEPLPADGTVVEAESLDGVAGGALSSKLLELHI